MADPLNLPHFDHSDNIYSETRYQAPHYKTYADQSNGAKLFFYFQFLV